MRDRLDALEREFTDVENRMADPSIHSTPGAYAELAKRHKELDAIVERSRALTARTGDLAAAREMFNDASGSDREEMRAEVDEAEADIERLTRELEVLLLPKDANDDRNVIVEIRGAEGGEEANLFARDLFEMYRAYAGRQGWGFEVLGSDPSPMGGYSDVSFLLKGDDVWTRMKHEGGPHRVQRVPVTEAQGRIHTSSATVTVLPEAEEVDVQLDPNDLQIDVYRSSGPGGQSVNTTDSAVRITHKPSGIVVSMQDEKSQLQNRERAMRVLRARLYEQALAEQQAELAADRRSQVGTGERAEKIRTYNYPERRVTDHRVKVTVHNLDALLQGELDEITAALQDAEKRKRLEQAAE
jgi:peptide chain release factor 1